MHDIEYPYLSKTNGFGVDRKEQQNNRLLYFFMGGRRATTRVMHGRSRKTIDRRMPTNKAGTEHVGFSLTRKDIACTAELEAKRGVVDKSREG